MSEVVTSGSPPLFRGPRDKLNELWRARELLRQLLGKELKIRYRNSTLGFLWSMITPAAMTVVFTAVFGIILKVPIEDFAAFFLPGFLVWQFFQNSAQSSLDAIVGNGSLIQKVYFPREVLPLSLVLSQLVHLGLALVVLVPWIAYTRGADVLVHLPAVLFGMVLLAGFTAGFSMLLAGANVGFRDLKELTQVLFLIWFYLTPVILPRAMIDQLIQTEPSTGLRLANAVVALNPMTWYVGWFQQTMYGGVTSAVGAACPVDPVSLVRAERCLIASPPTWPDPLTVAVCAGIAVVMFIVGYAAFTKMARNFAKAV